jgi:hypothetical protein
MLPAFKAVTAINGSSATAAGTVTSSVIDTLGFDWASIDIWGTTQAASTQAGSPSVLKLQESDNTTASNFVDIVGFRGGSATATNVDFLVGFSTTLTAVPSYKFNVDCRARKRYLSLVISPATSQTFFANANLGRPEQGISTAARANVLSLIEG